MAESATGLVVVGASAGGIEPLKRMVAGLPGDLPAAVAVVVHVSPTGSRLPQILSSAGALPASHAVDGEPLVAGRIYVAPPDRHLLVRDAHCAVGRGPPENGHRPAIDPLFRTAAFAYGARVVAVVLSGALTDGSIGVAAVAREGGVVIVQDPDEAEFPSMPANAIVKDQTDSVMRVAEIPAAVMKKLGDLLKEADVRENGRDEMIFETIRTVPFERDGPDG